MGDAWHSLTIGKPRFISSAPSLHLGDNPSQLSPLQPEKASLCPLVLALPGPFPCFPNVIPHNCPAFSLSHCQGISGSHMWSYNPTTVPLALSPFSKKKYCLKNNSLYVFFFKTSISCPVIPCIFENSVISFLNSLYKYMCNIHVPYFCLFDLSVSEKNVFKFPALIVKFPISCRLSLLATWIQLRPLLMFFFEFCFIWYWSTLTNNPLLGLMQYVYYPIQKLPGHYHLYVSLEGRIVFVSEF